MKRQLRIVCLGNFTGYYSAFLYGTLEGSIRCGAWFRQVQLIGQSLNEIYEQIMWFKPHILFCHMIFNKAPHNREEVFSILRKIKKVGVKIAYSAGDARMSPRFPHDISDIVDLGLLNSRMINHYEGIWNIPCIHWPYPCFYQNNIADTDTQFKHDVVFTGDLDLGRHHGPRTNFINKLKSKVSLVTYPTPTSGNTRFQTAELSSSCNVMLGFQMGLDVPGYLDVRPFQYIGAGALYFHDKCEEMDLLFKDGFHYVSFKRDDINDFMDKYSYYVIKKPEEGNKIRKQGFKYCQKFHSTKERVQGVIDYFNGKKYTLKYFDKKMIDEVDKKLGVITYTDTPKQQVVPETIVLTKESPNSGKVIVAEDVKQNITTKTEEIKFKEHRVVQGFSPKEVSDDIKRLVFERDSWTCKECGATFHIHCHNKKPQEGNEPGVGECITLCYTCHKNAHKMGKWFI
jgi:hypothetical protein